MYPKQHFFFGVVFSLVLLILFPKITWMGALIVLASTVLIDVDHYFYYVYKKRNLNLKRAFEWYDQAKDKFFSLSREQRNKIPSRFYFLHGTEMLIFLFIGIYLFPFFLFIFVGVAFHLLLDAVDQTVYHDRVDKISLIYDFFKFKKLKFIDEK